MSKEDMRKVVILGTGGTIAGVGVPGLTTGYFSGGMDIESLITGVPGLKKLAWLVGEQIANVNSDDITQEDWLRLTRRINELARREDIAGFVITHGTDTLEETAFFLNLTVKTRKPVVITGAMRPATALSPDGPFNLYQAVALAASPEAAGKGVLAVFSDAVYSAREKLLKMPYFYNAPVKKHTVETEFDLKEISELPKVAISYFHVDADPETLRFQYMKSDGLIIAGAGNGEMSLLWEEEMRKFEAIGKPVVITSRIHDGIVTLHREVPANVLSGDTLNPQKARILLMLALTKTKNIGRIRRIFERY